jgi:hypothetical protein
VEFGDRLYYNEVWWLRRGNVVRGFFNLREEIEICMKRANQQANYKMQNEFLVWHFL